MNTRALDEIESHNLAALNSAGIRSALLFLTQIGLKKSILDATEPMRRLFAATGFHEYARQNQGPDNKVIRPAVILTDSASIPGRVSLYRPNTKQGDPRMWFYQLQEFAKANDVCAIFVADGAAHILNLTTCRLADTLTLSGPPEQDPRTAATGLPTYAEPSRPHPNSLSERSIAPPQTFLAQFIRTLGEKRASIVDELLRLLREIASRGPLKAVCRGDTAVGRTIESVLGIPINSRRQPDFKGIELKSGRSTLTGQATRATLFACVPDWDLSALKSSADILQRFGYARGDNFRLYCEVRSGAANSQGLTLELDEIHAWLRELRVRPTIEDVCVWPLEKLHSRLLAKHRQTFWIKATPLQRADGEWFQLHSVTHTSDPSTEQFDRLLSGGTISIDHLIKRRSNGSAHERGPLFKIDRPRLAELFFGAPSHYRLSP